MKKCHFLPVKLRIEFKIALIVYKCLNNSAPGYLSNLIKPKDSLPSLRVYDDQLLLQIPKLHQSNYKNRKFSVAAPQIWNKLPLGIRKSNSTASFKTNLKTYYFEIFYNQ